ncbi:two-component sensor histidine kinase [Chimaeribacter coloradensis]|uniref:Sensor protein n=4 Tax=Enterobacterales TaxID=91347 RepID=A0A2N5DSZ3_9GAMM|nr:MULTISPECIES: heavy metal sensor histidine kinase [Enterobacterales]PLR29410.1 two-component sensor histidine kinase [Chimaeribacter coloradensis]
MKRNGSLTSRLSLVFACVMMSVWLLSSVLLVAALGSYFRSQDLTLLTGKLELATELLESEVRTGKLDTAGLARKLADAMVGHSGLYLSIRTADNQILADYFSPGFPVPAERFASEALKLNTLQTVEENDWRYNVMIKKIGAENAGRHRDVLITAAYDTGFHDEFIGQLKQWLMWLNGGLIFLSVLLGWLATRIGLRPLNEINRLASAITVNNLSERLPARHLPSELMPTVAEFNNMLERLEGSFRRLSEFSSDIAHELRTPVSNLMMQTQVALSRERDAASYREVLFSNLEELGRLARMSSDMLFLAKSENGLLALENEIFSAKAEFEELIEFFEPLAAENGKTLTLEGDTSMKGDRLMLRRALSNLITNAIKYSSDGAAILIRAEQQIGMAFVHISNRTEAITQENLGRLFDRFYRGDSSRQHNTDGAGLGLSITRAVVLAHNGTLQVFLDDDIVTFTVKIPAA